MARVQEGDCDMGGVFVAVSNTCYMFQIWWGDQDYQPKSRAVALEASGVCNCLHLVPTEMVPPRRGVTHLHCMVLWNQGEFRLLSSWRKLCRARILQAGRWGVAHVGGDDGELEVSGLSKAALAFYPACLYSVHCRCPDVCDEDLSVGMCFSSHPVPFICISLRDCFCPSL